MWEPPSGLQDPRPVVTAAPDADTALPELRQNPATTAPPPAPVAPELCGWIDGTVGFECSKGYTCKFNTDWYVAGCCTSDDCSWKTSCCGYDPGDGFISWSGTTSRCGNLDPYTVRYCLGENNYPLPFCATYRFENGYTMYSCTDKTTYPTETVLFTSAGETTRRAGILKLTGRNGPASAITDKSDAVTVTVTPSAIPTSNSSTSAGSSTPSAGVIAGSVIGGAAFGAIVTLLAVLLTWYFRKRSEKANNMQAHVPHQSMSGGSAVYQNYNGVDPRYSAIPPSTSVSPNPQYSGPNSQYSVPISQYSGIQSAPPTVAGSPPLKDHTQYTMTPVVEAPDNNGQIHEMPVGR